MKARLTLFALTALLALVGVSIWATSKVGLVDAVQILAQTPAAGTHPWFVATLFDAYFGFLWFWLWVTYKETAWPARLAWLALILAFGNIAMAAYVLLQLRRLPPDAQPRDLLLHPTK